MARNRRPSRSSRPVPYRRPTEYPIESPTTAPAVAAPAGATGSIPGPGRAASSAAPTSTISPGNGTPTLSTPTTTAHSR
ncbi:hypothetical protein [Pseudonocardia sp. NPDC046786]|uniref:hypothetical protein n=1 Tax=Pseudonocardia sp. NPDC046786 TaxID=3155471 RepID=UPI0033F942F3